MEDYSTYSLPTGTSNKRKYFGLAWRRSDVLCSATLNLSTAFQGVKLFVLYDTQDDYFSVDNTEISSNVLVHFTNLNNSDLFGSIGGKKK